MTESELGELLEALPLPALLIGPRERILAMNANASGLLGQGLVGRHYVAALRQPALIDTIEGVGRDRLTRNVDYTSHDGDRDMIWAANVAVAGAGILVSFEDRTLAAEAGQMRRDFVANVSHELRTPLTALMGYIETLQGPARNDQVARDRFLATMAGEANRMNRLVQDLLSLSRVEAAARVKPTEEVDLPSLIQQVKALLGTISAERETRIEFVPPPDPVVVPGDNDQLRQVFVNLLENAIKYGGGTVTVDLTVDPHIRELRGPGVRIDITDNGAGIDPLHLPRLTQRFYRVDTHRSREVGGTGLGLAIVKHILSRHRGRLRISSEIGQGSCFSVLLPTKTA
ncbi:ATP-binding protein [Palleronia sp. LCG004]|uniref:ATP-binding protein n=1 Tax=Palleronia sp. LCG004 TaxID=3079304 RepID=UPI002942E657|nr:ATP-binding protein [Palleronia sp. LCG004]WOI57221.1 ATP-binding protein [Palleronia sp. LCG004]